MLFMDLDCARLQGVVEMSRRGVGIATFHKVAFSSRKVALATKNEANYC